jgi:hypothetical protein
MMKGKVVPGLKPNLYFVQILSARSCRGTFWKTATDPETGKPITFPTEQQAQEWLDSK